MQDYLFNYSKEFKFIILNLNWINEGITCPHCNNYTDIVHQTRPILVRDLSIFGRLVYFWGGDNQPETKRYQGLSQCMIKKDRQQNC